MCCCSMYWITRSRCLCAVKLLEVLLPLDAAARLALFHFRFYFSLPTLLVFFITGAAISYFIFFYFFPYVSSFVLSHPFFLFITLSLLSTLQIFLVKFLFLLFTYLFFLLFLIICFSLFINHFLLLYFLYLHKFTNNSLGKECTSHVRYFSFYFIFVFHFIHFSFHMFSFIFPSVICFHSFNMFFLLFPFPLLLSNFSLYFMLIFLD